MQMCLKTSTYEYFMGKVKRQGLGCTGVGLHVESAAFSSEKLAVLWAAAVAAVAGYIDAWSVVFHRSHYDAK